MSAKATATFLLVLAFLVGLVAGVLVERTLFGRSLLASQAEAPAVVLSPGGERREPGGADREQLAQDLGLTLEQRQRVDEVLDEQQRQIHEIMRSTRPQTRAVLRETRAQIEAVLTAEQRVRWEQMMAEARAAKPHHD
jgi:Spy/CpxP family protein refolding chaperone